MANESILKAISQVGTVNDPEDFLNHLEVLLEECNCEVVLRPRFTTAGALTEVEIAHDPYCARLQRLQTGA
jgi:hypothetical protein